MELRPRVTDKRWLGGDEFAGAGELDGGDIERGKEKKRCRRWSLKGEVANLGTPAPAQARPGGWPRAQPREDA
jgi:hypothetical protein